MARPVGGIVKSHICAAVVGQCFLNSRLAGGIVKSRVVAAVWSESFFKYHPLLDDRKLVGGL